MTMQPLTQLAQPETLEQPECSTTQPSAPQPVEVRAGSLCPRCGEGRLDYDGLLMLSCPVCFWAQGGSFT